jgi:hypothetical protein
VFETINISNNLKYNYSYLNSVTSIKECPMHGNLLDHIDATDLKYVCNICTNNENVVELKEANPIIERGLETHLGHLQQTMLDTKE